MSNPEDKNKILYHNTLKVYNSVRVSCFTLKNDNLLMWAHYANSHTGFCVKLGTQNSSLKFSFKVTYDSDNYPKVTYPLDGDEIFKPLLCKARCWEYEEEYRSLLIPFTDKFGVQDGEGYLIQRTDITDIYIGLRAKDDDVKKLMRLVERSSFTPNIWQAKTNFDSYKIDFIPFK